MLNKGLISYFCHIGMKHFAKLLFSFGLVFGLLGCFETVEFPDTPKIEFESLSYVDTDGIDSLILKFSFEDGDSNIGLTNSSQDLLFPYQIYDVVLDDGNDVVTISSDTVEFPIFTAPVFITDFNGEIIRQIDLSNRELLSENDIRPAYNCEDYEIVDADTVYVVRNEFHHNFHIEFQEKIGGEYFTIDFREVFNSDDCTLGNFNGRIPLFDPNGQEGVITYAMLSQAFRLAFLDNTIRLKFYVIDRDLNRSNEAFSQDFVLGEL